MADELKRGILDKISAAADVAALPRYELPLLADEIRQRLVDVVSQTGGHLASSLGVVELTIALMRVFAPPADKVVWDVGHQSYPWKLLTGRRESFHTLRQFGGISGFTKRTESEYDPFGAGHAGTALSAAVGMAVARDRRGGDEAVIAVVGDAALANGVTLEALNNISDTTKRLIVILNDNEMSIGGPVGALSSHLGRLLSNPRYNRWKGAVERLAHRLQLGRLRAPYHRTEQAVKSLFLQNAFFEELGLRYMGPIDGHNIGALCDALTIARNYDRPILVHVSTLKGRGFRPAEQHPEEWHGVGKFDPLKSQDTVQSVKRGYSQVMGEALAEMARNDTSLVAITAAMRAGTGLDSFAKEFPQRFFDVGICEEHAVVFAAGLATEGLRPVLAIYSTFLQRAVDCVMHDVCLQNLPVIFCIDRAGAVGNDGPTHHGMYDIAMLRCLPGISLLQPRSGRELVQMLQAARQQDGPVAIRYPRDNPPADEPEELELLPEALEWGKAEVVESGDGRGSEHGFVAMWALGDCVELARESAALLHEQGIRVEVVNARFIKPLDRELLAKQAAAGAFWVTIENGALAGGFGSALLEAAGELAVSSQRVLRFGWPDRFVPQGTVDELRRECGLTAPAISEAVVAAMVGLKSVKAEA